MPRVAVYGTLKKGGALHGNMEAINAKFIKEATIKNQGMYNVGWYPAVIDEEGKTIKVEVYEVDDYGLSILDGVEGYPGLYQRKETPEGWLYYFKNPTRVDSLKEVENGNWPVISGEEEE